MGKKQKVITELFKKCEKNKDFVFDNSLVKQICKEYGFGNPFDITKLDNTSKFPKNLLDKDYFILHLGSGRHKFVKGIKNGFHSFEKINKDDIFDWKSSERIYYNQSKCYNLALKYFNNPEKKAIIKIAEEVYISSFASIKISYYEWV